ncbi:hypothetical protein M5D96_004314, partial [Drosophila gunungcola]
MTTTSVYIIYCLKRKKEEDVYALERHNKSWFFNRKIMSCNSTKKQKKKINKQNKDKRFRAP